MKILLSFCKYAVVLLVVLVIAGSVYQWWAAGADRARFPAPGELFAVDDAELHIDCRGQGQPTVLLEAGLTSGSSSWSLVHDELAEQTRVCAYDRPGMDWSPPADAVIEAPTVSRRLAALLDAARIEGPLVLVGMSAGGVFVRDYYARYPADVVGMVLVDSSHEQQGNRLPELGDPEMFTNVLSLCAWLQPIGLVRAFGLLDAFQDQFELPPGMRALARAHAYQSHTCRAMLLESEGFEREVRDTAPPASLGDLPLIVLSQGKAPEANEAFGVTLAQAQALAVVWDELQNELTALSSAGERRVAERSGHVIQLEQPRIVIDAITDMVVQLRAQSV